MKRQETSEFSEPSQFNEWGIHKHPGSLLNDLDISTNDLYRYMIKKIKGQSCIGLMFFLLATGVSL